MNKFLNTDVNKHTEKKGNLTYLSWAWAWAEVLKVDPKASWCANKFEFEGRSVPFMVLPDDTCMVETVVTVDGNAKVCVLPVMDNRNRPIKNPDSFSVNTAIMRCMTKAIALHGLGLYIYAGEDLPEEPEDHLPLPGVTPEATKRVETMITKAIVETAAGNPDANAELFRDGITEYLNLSRTKAELSNYWKVNQQTLDALKVSHPDIFKQIRDSFSEAKAKLE